MTRPLLLIFTAYLALSTESFSQNFTSSLPVHMNGYVLNLCGEILFQPCEDSTKKVWEAMYNTSIPLWYFREDLYLEAIEKIGDSVKVNFRDSKENKSYYSNFAYFYCCLEVNMMFLDTTRFNVFIEPQYQISFDGKSYPAKGFLVDNRIVKLIPKRDSDLLLMYRYYDDKGYTVPKWLQEAVKKRFNLK